MTLALTKSIKFNNFNIKKVFFLEGKQIETSMLKIKKENESVNADLIFIDIENYASSTIQGTNYKQTWPYCIS